MRATRRFFFLSSTQSDEGSSFSTTSRLVNVSSFSCVPARRTISPEVSRMPTDFSPFRRRPSLAPSFSRLALTAFLFARSSCSPIPLSSFFDSASFFFLLTLGCYLADQNAPFEHVGPHPDDAVLVKVLDRVFAHVGDFPRQLFLAP